MQVIKYFCDRCKEELNPSSIGKHLIDQEGNILHHLCESCNEDFKKFIKGVVK